ncbi:MAG: hypothetical protein ABJA90_07005 [Ginsengibacter sp.]
MRINAQEQIEGEYYLHGAMEVATGFLLKPDSTFQFFFSYGALDREGSGKWFVKGKEVFFNSRPKPELDFAIIKAAVADNNFTILKILDSNKIILRYVFAFLKYPDTTIEEQANEEGEIKVNRKGAKEISLVFEFSPEKISNFQVNKDNNYYEFKMEPSIMEVFFENFHLQIESGTFKGKNPLLDDKEYKYEKSN